MMIFSSLVTLFLLIDPQILSTSNIISPNGCGGLAVVVEAAMDPHTKATTAAAKSGKVVMRVENYLYEKPNDDDGTTTISTNIGDSSGLTY